MGRPQKQGLDYFSFDVSFFQDIRIRKLIKNHGIQAVPVYEILLCNIYESGYYLEWDDDLPFTISEISHIEEDTILKIFNYCIEVGLFNKEIFEQYHVITSRSIQQRYLIACSLTHRKVPSNSPYLLIKVSQESVKSEKTPVSSEQTLVFSEENPISSEETQENSEKSTQIKGKEKKEDIGTNVPPSSSTTGKDDEINLLAFQDFFNRTMQEHGAQIPTITQIGGQRRQRLLARVKEYGKEAIRKAVINAATAPFLNGAGEKVFVASLDWIIRPNNFPKVLEGNYNHIVTNPSLNNHGTVNNNGYRSSEDILNGAVGIVSRIRAKGQQPTSELPVV